MPTSAARLQREVHHAAQLAFSHQPNWVAFYREMFGRGGLIRRKYPTLELRAEFRQTETYAEIRRMLDELRRKHATPVHDPAEPTRVITVRIPKSVHEALRAEAHDHQTSMNKLCIMKLLPLLDHDSLLSDEEEPLEEEAASAASEEG
jgi:uncharacterized protein (DUF4415 family)